MQFRFVAGIVPDVIFVTDRRPLFARAIAEKYGLNISADAALKRLRQS